MKKYDFRHNFWPRVASRFNEIRSILNFAHENNINTLDTAKAYLHWNLFLKASSNFINYSGLRSGSFNLPASIAPYFINICLGSFLALSHKVILGIITSPASV